jgi:hypothetical protein
VGVVTPVVPPSTPGTSRGWADPDEPDRVAVVAHGLLNTLAVLTLAAGTLKSDSETLNPAVEHDLMTTIIRHSALLGDALVFVLPSGSEAFTTAAAAIVASGILLAATPNHPSQHMLRDLMADCVIVAAGLGDTVRGLPAEVVEFLDTLRT